MRILDYRSCGWELDVTFPQEDAKKILDLWEKAHQGHSCHNADKSTAKKARVAEDAERTPSLFERT